MKISSIITICIISAFSCVEVLAGDYFPYRAKKITYEFATPFDDDKSPQLEEAKVTIVTKSKPWGEGLGSNEATLLKSITIQTGKSIIKVPDAILNDLGEVSLRTLDFYWVGGRHFFRIGDKNDSDIYSGRQIVIKNGVIVDYSGNASVKEKLPNVFKNAPSKAKK